MGIVKCAIKLASREHFETNKTCRNTCRKTKENFCWSEIQLWSRKFKWLEHSAWIWLVGGSKDIFCLKTFDTRTSIHKSKMNTVARTQLAFHMLNLQIKITTSMFNSFTSYHSVNMFAMIAYFGACSLMVQHHFILQPVWNNMHTWKSR